jgi:hypothetical protein
MDMPDTPEIYDDSLEAWAQRAQPKQGDTTPKSFVLSRLDALEKPPLKEELIEPGAEGADGCTCNAVCACVPVDTCACFSVCQCNSVDSCLVDTVIPCSCKCQPIWIPG